MKKQKISNFNTLPVIEIFNKELCEYLPQDNGQQYIPVISAAYQNKVLKRFKDNTEKAKFSFTINGLTGELANVYGIKKCLGYDEKTFSVPFFLILPIHNILLPIG